IHFFFFSSRRRHTRFSRDWSSDVCSSDLVFLATTFGVYMMFDYWQMAALIGMVGMAVFLYVLSRYNDVKAKRDFNAKLIAINERSEERRVGKECRFSVWSLS